VLNLLSSLVLINVYLSPDKIAKRIRAEARVGPPNHEIMSVFYGTLLVMLLLNDVIQVMVHESVCLKNLVVKVIFYDFTSLLLILAIVILQFLKFKH